MWLAIYSMITGCLLGLDKDNLRLIIGFIKGHCEIIGFVDDLSSVSRTDIKALR